MNGNSLKFSEKRTATRYPVALFVEFENGTGWTVDISTSGALIETSQSFLYGAVIAFSMLQSNQDDVSTLLYCQGVVVRVEQEGGAWRLGVVMEDVRFGG